ncbi:MAG: hypothetical protein ACRDZX_16415 [Acidimicrobiales bacterium]
MNSKYITNLVLGLFGGFIVVETLKFSHPTERWVAFAFAIAVVAISLSAWLDRSRGLVQQSLDGLMTALGGTMIGISVVYTGPTAQWIDFALALGWVATAVTGMSMNEVEAWRVTHGMAELQPFSHGPHLRSHPREAAGTRIAS